MRRTLSLFGVLLFVGLSACATAPISNRKQLLLLSEDEENSMGLQSYQETLAKEPVSSNPVLIAQVERVGRRIAAATGKTNYQWEFKVVDKPVVNAFCLPGGKVVVYTGILPVAVDDAGLATVLGHEIAHAIARHGGERVSEGLLVNVGLEAASAAMGSSDPKTVQTVTSLLGAGAAVGVVMPFSRTQESEADHLGLVYMAKAGYDPAASLAFWKRMETSTTGAPPEILSDHPSDATRVKQIEQWLPEARTYFTSPAPVEALTVPAGSAAPTPSAVPAPAPVLVPAAGSAPPPPPPRLR